MPDTPSFEEAAERLTPSLRRYLLHLVGGDELAEDLLQESLLRIARALPGFQGRSRLETWALGVATHVAVDHLRRGQSRPAPVDLEDARAVPAPEPGEERLVLDEMGACVREEIEALPAEYRAALVLHDLEGLTARQTAEACGCSLATAKIRIHRARTHLREALRRDCELYHGDDQVLRCDRKPR